jgi:hypothetical protein
VSPLSDFQHIYRSKRGNQAELNFSCQAILVASTTQRSGISNDAGHKGYGVGNAFAGRCPFYALSKSWHEQAIFWGQQRMSLAVSKE